MIVKEAMDSVVYGAVSRAVSEVGYWIVWRAMNVAVNKVGNRAVDNALDAEEADGR
jgi:hypothetical protein